jgi:hypothetical protein
MRWRRGLFRLWLVWALLWQILAVTVTGIGPVLAQYGSGFPTEEERKASFYRHIDDVCRKGPDSVPDWECIENEGGDVTYEQAVKSLKAFFWVGLVVPVAVFWSGVVLMWIVDGFRRTQ